MKENLIYKIKKDKHNKESLQNILKEHKEIKFISLMAIDLSGNVTDERIPIKIFLEDLEKFLYKTAVQTDGSSVDLPEIATINDAKVDMIIDRECDWFIDYNEDLFDEDTNLPVGTIIIPAFLHHKGKAVDSRSILKEAMIKTKEEILNLIKTNRDSFKKYNIEVENIDEISYTVATELEFWVKTPYENTEIEELATSEGMHEQYWNKISGTVRTAIEECLITMEKYELEPEMGHKEVGGVKPQLGFLGKYDHVMEQIEIDWKYSNPMQAADNQIFVKELVKKIFMKYGLETTFKAKPIEKVAGSGMHVHLGMSVKKKDGKRINLFNSYEDNFLSCIGYGALMGILKNYEVMNPFISSTDDALRRLKPGYEAPVCIVTSLGKEKNEPSRNRSVLIGLVKDKENPFATRFEFRSPNPSSNLYITIAVSYLCMLDGIRYAIKNNKTEQDLYKEICKKQNEYYGYLDKDRIYRSEEDVFEYYTKEEREKLFGKSPRTVWENINNLNNKKQVEVLKNGNILTELMIKSFSKTALEKWRLMICKRKIKEYFNEISLWKKKESKDEKDNNDWQLIENKKRYIYKTIDSQESLFSKIYDAFENDEWEKASDLVIDLEEKMEELRTLYSKYSKNIIE